MRATPPNLTSADFTLLLDIIRVVREVTRPADLAQVFAEQVLRAVKSDAVSVNDVDPQAGLVSFVMRPESFRWPESSHQALQELLSEHPLISYAQRTGDGSARTISDFWTQQVWHDSDLYQRVYAPMGVEYQMSVALATPRPAVVGVALNRESRDFSLRDRAVLNHLRPHLSQAWRQSREHAQLKALIDAATTALNATESGVILLDDPVHELTPGAFTELYRFFGRPPAETSLPHRVERWVEVERFKSENAGLGDYAKPLTTTRGGTRLVLRYVPSRASHTAAILIRRANPENASTQSAMLGLSPRETQVLNELIKGSSNAEIAAQLHLTPATVKKYLDHIYVKLGARGRVHATAIAFSTPSANWGARPS